MPWKRLIPLIIFVAMGVLLYGGLSRDPSYLPSALQGKPVPAFSLPLLPMTEGAAEVIRTSEELKGKPYLLNFWATWCATCVQEHPYLTELAKRGVPIIGVNYKDEDAPAVKWLAKLGNPYREILADREGRLGIDLGVYGAPETFVIDSHGVIQYRHAGAVTEKVWLEQMAPLMK